MREPLLLDLVILIVGIIIIFWKMHGLKLPSQIAAEQLAHTNELRAQMKQPLLVGPKVNFFSSFGDWLQPWRWGRGDLLKPTTPTGGDLGAHVWLPDFVRRSLLPKGRLTGWSNDFFGGFPALNFYFPIPMLSIVGLSFLLPYGIAFKLVSVAGICTLPLASYRFARLSAMPRPAPLFFGLASFVFLLGRNYDLFIYGGGILPTMAGEFSFSISLTFALLFLGNYVRLLRTGMGRRSTAVLLGCSGLSHILPTLFAFGTAVVLLVTFSVASGSRRRTVTMITNSTFVSVLAAMLGSWWTLPFARNLAYTNDMGWEKSTLYVDFLFPFLASKRPGDSQLIAIAFALGAVGVAQATRSLRAKRRLRLASGPLQAAPDQASGELVCIAIAISMVVAGLLFRFMPQYRLWNARVLPFWFLCGLFLGAYGAAVMPRLSLRGKVVVGTVGVLIACGIPLGLLPGWLPVPRYSEGMVGLQQARRSVDHHPMMIWTGHNFAGYESQPGWAEFSALMTEAGWVGKTEGCGRAMWEHEEIRFSSYGTTLSPMLLPFFTRGCIGSMDGIYFESSATIPHHWITASLVSAPAKTDEGGGRLYSGPTNPQRQLPYPQFDLRRGLDAMQLSGVRYFIAVTDETKQAAATMPKDFVKVGASGPYVFYRIVGSEIVSALKEEPVVATGIGQSQTKGWLDAGLAQWGDPSKFPDLLAANGPRTWQRAKLRVAHRPGVKTFGTGTSIGGFTRRPLPPVVVSDIVQSNVEISFRVDRIGVPVLIHTSYFPNWRASGAIGPYRVLPNFMVVVPTQKNVRIQYGFSGADRIGGLTSLVGVMVAIGPALHRGRRWVRRWVRRGRNLVSE